MPATRRSPPSPSSPTRTAWVAHRSAPSARSSARPSAGSTCAARRYKPIEVDEQCEGLTLLGDIAIGDDGKASLHMHAVLGLQDGTTRGGHFLKGIVRPTPRSHDRRDAGASAPPQAGVSGHRAHPTLISGTSAANGPSIGHVIPARGDHDAKPKEMDAIALLKARPSQGRGPVREVREGARRRAQEGSWHRRSAPSSAIHATIEEEIFYPACKGKVEDGPARASPTSSTTAPRC